MKTLIENQEKVAIVAKGLAVAKVWAKWVWERVTIIVMAFSATTAIARAKEKEKARDMTRAKRAKEKERGRGRDPWAWERARKDKKLFHRALQLLQVLPRKRQHLLYHLNQSPLHNPPQVTLPQLQ
jgi:hypothetical protein